MREFRSIRGIEITQFVGSLPWWFLELTDIAMRLAPVCFDKAAIHEFFTSLLFLCHVKIIRYCCNNLLLNSGGKNLQQVI